MHDKLLVAKKYSNVFHLDYNLFKKCSKGFEDVLMEERGEYYD